MTDDPNLPPDLDAIERHHQFLQRQAEVAQHVAQHGIPADETVRRRLAAYAHDGGDNPMTSET